MEVTVLNRQRSHRVRRRELSAFLERLALELPGEDADSLSMCLVSDRKMREYNRDLRGRNVLRSLPVNWTLWVGARIELVFVVKTCERMSDLVPDGVEGNFRQAGDPTATGGHSCVVITDHKSLPV